MLLCGLKPSLKQRSWHTPDNKSAIIIRCALKVSANATIKLAKAQNPVEVALNCTEAAKKIQSVVK